MAGRVAASGGLMGSLGGRSGRFRVPALAAVLVLSALIAVVSFPNPAVAATVTEGAFTLTDEGVALTEGTDYTYEGNVLTITTDKALTIGMSSAAQDAISYTYKDSEGQELTQTVTGTKSDRIAIDLGEGKTANVTLAGVAIDVSGTSDSAAISTGASKASIALAEGTTSVLFGGYDAAALNVGAGGIELSGPGTLFASGGSYGAGIGSGRSASAGDIVISGSGVIAAGGDNAAGIGTGYHGDGEVSVGSITVKNSAVTAVGGRNAAGIGSGWGESVGDIEIFGGTVVASGGDDGAGIGSGWQASIGNIVLRDSRVTAKGGGDAAGIGSGQSGSTTGDITISDGIIVASTGGNAAGIGSGYEAPVGSIAIEDSEVEAKGGSGSAGIGSGYEGSAGDVLVSDGTLKATSVDRGAGIGSGCQGSVGNIAISSGCVVANGGEWGAGIGSGRGGSVGDVSVSGGTVVAAGGDYGAGIGSGYSSYSQTASVGTIALAGGNVTAKGGQYGPGIGAGWDARAEGVEISGGEVVAAGGEFGAGIGSGYSRDSSVGVITVTGGAVTAEGGRGAAGVGSGRASSVASVSISGGRIDAVAGQPDGGSEPSAIGAGVRANGEVPVSIAGGRFADKSEAAITSNKVYGVAPAAGCIVFSNDDVATSEKYPVAVGMTSALTMKEAVSVPFGSQFKASDVIESLGLGGSKTVAGAALDALGGITYEYRAVGAAEGDAWTSGLPTELGSYELKVSLASGTVDGAWYAPVSGECGLTIVKAKPSLNITADPAALRGGGKVKLAVKGTGLPEGAAITVTCDNERYNPAAADYGTYTVTLPNRSATYEFTAVYAGDDNHKPASASVSVKVTRSGGSGGGGAVVNPSKPVEVPSSEGGTTAVEPKSAKPGEKVTVTAKPDAGREVGSVAVTDADGKPVEVEFGKDASTWTFDMPRGGATVSVTYIRVYPDVDYGSWYAKAVRFVATKGLMLGYGDTGLFGVGHALTRGELAVILWRNAGGEAGGKPDQSGSVNETGMPDVADGAFYTEAANWAVANGIINGYDLGGGKRAFGPNDPVTLEQMVAIIGNATVGTDAMSKVDPSVLDCYNDKGTVSGWAVRATAWATQAGLVSGYDNHDGTRSIAAGVDVVRERAAGVLLNAFEKGILE